VEVTRKEVAEEGKRMADLVIKSGDLIGD